MTGQGGRRFRRRPPGPPPEPYPHDDPAAPTRAESLPPPPHRPPPPAPPFPPPPIWSQVGFIHRPRRAPFPLASPGWSGVIVLVIGLTGFAIVGLVAILAITTPDAGPPPAPVPSGPGWSEAHPLPVGMPATLDEGLVITVSGYEADPAPAPAVPGTFLVHPPRSLVRVRATVHNGGSRQIAFEADIDAVLRDADGRGIRPADVEGSGPRWPLLEPGDDAEVTFVFAVGPSGLPAEPVMSASWWLSASGTRHLALR